MSGVLVFASFPLSGLFGFPGLLATGGGSFRWLRDKRLDCLVFRGCIEVRCKAPDLYI